MIHDGVPFVNYPSEGQSSIEKQPVEYKHLNGPHSPNSGRDGNGRTSDYRLG